MPASRRGARRTSYTGAPQLPYCRGRSDRQACCNVPRSYASDHFRPARGRQRILVGPVPRRRRRWRGRPQWRRHRPSPHAVGRSAITKPAANPRSHRRREVPVWRDSESCPLGSARCEVVRFTVNGITSSPPTSSRRDALISRQAPRFETVSPGPTGLKKNQAGQGHRLGPRRSRSR